MKTQGYGSEEKMDNIHIATTLTTGSNRQIIASTRTHQMLLDVPKERGGDDLGPTPPECLAISLGGCIVNICRFLAQEKQIVLKDLRVSVTGHADPSRAFGFTTDIRAGFAQLTVLVEFSSDLLANEKEMFRQELIDRCPLCDTIGNPTPLQISFA